MNYKYKLIVFVLLAVVTIVCHTYIDRYKKSGPEMLTDGWSVRVPQGNTGKIKENGLFLFSLDPKKSVNIYQNVQPFEPGTILRLSADMACENVIPGEKPWNRARLLLAQNDGQIDRWGFPHGVAAIDGTQDWASYQGVFIVQPGTRRIRVIAQLSQCSGTFELKNIHLYRVIQVQAHDWAQKSILGLWGMFGIFLLVSCFLNHTNAGFLRVLLGLSFILIIIGTSMPGEVKNQVSQEVSHQLTENSAVLAQVLPIDISKAGHFVFFGLFGVILSIMLRQTPFCIILVHILMVAGGTELSQFYIDGRSPLFADFFIDAAGGVAGLLVVLLFNAAFPGRQDRSGQSLVK